MNRRRFQLRRVQRLCVVIFRASFPPSYRSPSSLFYHVRAYVFIIVCISCRHILYRVLHFAAVSSAQESTVIVSVRLVRFRRHCLISVLSSLSS